jgi:hypothetical protein
MGSIACQFLAIIGGRVTQDAFEHAVEMRQRLKTHLIGDFADPSVIPENSALGAVSATRAFQQKL